MKNVETNILFTTGHRKHIKCWKGDILLLHEKYHLFLNLMAGTLLKKLGRAVFITV